MTHICVSELTIIGSDNALSPGRRQAIILTNAGILLIAPLGTNFNEILIEALTFYIQENVFKGVVCEMAAILQTAFGFWAWMSGYVAHANWSMSQYQLRCVSKILYNETSNAFSNFVTNWILCNLWAHPLCKISLIQFSQIRTWWIKLEGTLSSKRHSIWS